MVIAGDLWEHAPFNTAAPALRRVGDISFAGDGEPTAAPGFAAAVAAVVDVRARYGLEGVPLSLLTNATLFHRDKVRAGLDVLSAAGGQIWAKLDAGTEDWFHRVDGTTLAFDRVLRNIEWARKEMKNEKEEHDRIISVQREKLSRKKQVNEDIAQNLKVEINGNFYDCSIIKEPLYDPRGTKMRS